MPRRRRAVRPTPVLTEDEAGFQAAIIQLAETCGWLWHHTPDGAHNARPPKGVSRPCRGFPDLALCRAGVFIVAELKKAGGRVSPEQREWIADLEAAGVDVRIWRPKNWPEIEALLKAPVQRAKVSA